MSDRPKNQAGLTLIRSTSKASVAEPGLAELRASFPDWSIMRAHGEGHWYAIHHGTLHPHAPLFGLWPVIATADLAALRAELTLQAACTAWKNDFDEAVAHALGEVATPETHATHRAAHLTRREREIADLVARGLRNKDIAAALVISQRTVEGHVEHILHKLDFSSRAQIASWVFAECGRWR
jgi:DNA-binding CsgD family transcriptional regulator